MFCNWLHDELTLRRLFYSQNQYESSLIVLCGLPGAGKSTLARHIVELTAAKAGFLHSSQRCIHVEFDAINGQDFADIRERSRELVVNELKKGGIVIVDDNQFYKSMRKEYARLATLYHAAYLLVYVDVPLKHALRRNEARQGKQRVPDEVILRMAERFDEPKNCLRVSGLENPNVLAWQVLLACDKLAPNKDDAAIKQHALNEDSTRKDLERKERIRQAVVEAKAKGLSGEELNRIALGYKEV